MVIDAYSIPTYKKRENGQNEIVTRKNMFYFKLF